MRTVACVATVSTNPPRLCLTLVHRAPRPSTRPRVKYSHCAATLSPSGGTVCHSYLDLRLMTTTFFCVKLLIIPSTDHSLPIPLIL